MVGGGGGGDGNDGPYGATHRRVSQHEDQLFNV